MCGIVAIFSPGGAVIREALENATKSLEHRGPDGQRYWIAPDHRVGLGHARLSIIDLTTGDQPIANERENLRIIVNGEFYGYEATQKELENLGHQLRTRSDSEIALHLYEEFGADCVRRLRGEFALVLWNAESQTLFAARDRFGIKPLFYAFHDGTLYLASEVKALFAAGVPRRWDSESVYYSGGFGGHQMRTLFEGVQQVPPGHYMIATENHIQLNRYWDFDYPKADPIGPVRSDAEYAEEFREVFDEAVRIRLRADVPVGCYLSGGIDSCAVLGMAARHHRGPVRAFTLTFDRPEYNEGAIAEEMAAKVKADYYPVPIRQDELADNFSDAILQSETLCVNAHGVAKYLLSRAVRKAGYKVVLTGEGSDEILGGYLHFRRDTGSNGKRTPTDAGPAFQSHGSLSSGGSRQDLDGVRRLLGFVPGWMETASALSGKMHVLLAESFLQACKDHDGPGSFFNDIDVRGQLIGRDPLHQSLYLWAKTRLPNYILTMLGDRMEMAHSIEGRVPFLDHRFVEVMRAQPITQKIRGATQKYVLREAVRDVITETVYRRPKHPFLSPPLTLDPQGRFGALLQDMLRGSVLASMPFFDQRKVVGVLDSLHIVDESSRVANDQALMLILSACVIHDRLRLSA